MPHRSISILLVEDSPLDSRLLHEGLKPAIASGEVFLQTVKRLSQAIDELRTNEFSCVLLDLGLPDGQGIGNVSALREVDPKAAIVVLTGLDDEKLAVEALKRGAQDYLVKGATASDGLMRMVRRAVLRNRQTLALQTRRDQAFFEASHDAQTLLPNAALFADRARQWFHHPAAPPPSLACLRVQGIESARSRYGAVVGDELLRDVVQLLGEGLPPTATLARLEANVFALTGLPSETLQGHLTQCRQALAGLNQIGGCAVEVSLRFGVVQDDGQGVEACIEAALAALESTTDLPAAIVPSVTVSGPTPSEAPVGRWQPWADLRESEFAGVELLPVEGQDGSVATVLSQAEQLAHQWQQWQASRFEPAKLALTLPAAVLVDESLPVALSALFRRAALPASRVQLLVGEAAFRAPDRSLPILTQLRREGFGVVMEGDGSSDIALADFAAFPVQTYRLSKGFTRHLLAENLQGRSRRLLTALLGAAEALGAAVIANGVDTREALAALRLMGLHLVQGRALAPDGAADTLPILWERGPAKP